MGNSAATKENAAESNLDQAELGKPFVSPKNITAKATNKNIESVYSLSDKLGEGAYSTVFKGVKKDNGDMVAVKKVTKESLPSSADVKALLGEVGILQEIHHPHVMRIYGFYEDKKAYYLVTELVVGGELFDRIVDKKSYNERVARDLVKIFLETLDFLHSNDIVHRDLKPENLLLASKEDDVNIKIADFGFAKHTSEKLNVVCGTPDYIAPEVCALLDIKKPEKRPCYGTQCDIWSAGVIVYVLMGGYPPFYDESRPRLFKKIRAGKFEFHPQYWDGVSFEAKDLISKMLTVNPDSRWTAKQLLQHDWFGHTDEHLEGKDLSSTQSELKRYNARRKFKSAVDAILAAARIEAMFEESHAGAEHKVLVAV